MSKEFGSLEADSEIRRFREQRLLEVFVKNHFLLKAFREERRVRERLLPTVKKAKRSESKKLSSSVLSSAPESGPAKSYSDLSLGERRRLLWNPEDHEPVGNDTWSNAMDLWLTYSASDRRHPDSK